MLPLGAKSADPYRLTPRELFEIGKIEFGKRRFKEAAARLTDLFTNWNLNPDAYKETARLLLDSHLELGPAASIVKYFEIIKEKYPDLEITFEKILKVGYWHHSRTNSDGYYAIADNQVSNYVGAFARVSYSPDRLVEGYIDAGIRIGPGPLRDNDFIGAGVAYALTNDPALGSQSLFELTYQAQFGWLTSQPDFQLLLEHPRSTAIFATRVTIVL